MGVPRFLFSDLSAITFSASAGATAGYPLTNLQDYDPNVYWLSGATTANQVLKLDFGTAVSGSAFYAVVGNDWASLGDIGLEVQYSLNGSTGWTTVWDSWDLGNLFSASGSVYSQTPTSVVASRYWRVLFRSATPLSEAPSASLIYLGPGFTFDTAEDWGSQVRNAEYQTAQAVNLQGTIRSSQAYAGRLIDQLRFTYQSDTVRQNFQLFHQSVRGRLYPFAYFDSQGLVPRLVRFDADFNPVELFRYGLNNFAELRLKDVETNY